jgi:hypothetical protein
MSILRIDVDLLTQAERRDLPNALLRRARMSGSVHLRDVRRHDPTEPVLSLGTREMTDHGSHLPRLRGLRSEERSL